MRKNLFYAFGSITMGVAILFLTTNHPWLSFIFLLIGLLSIMSGGKKKIYSGEQVIKLEPSNLGGETFYLLTPSDHLKITRQARIEYNSNYPALGTGEWQVVFLEDDGSRWRKTEYGSSARGLVVLAVQYIMGDPQFPFKWSYDIRKRQWITKE